MREILLSAVRRHGVISRAAALTLAARHVVDDAVRAGVIVPVFPGVYVLREHQRDTSIRRLAALEHRRGSALSHTDALEVWNLPSSPGGAIHLTVPATQPKSCVAGLEVHRRRRFDVVVRGGLRVVPLEQAVVESWPLLPPIDRRVPAIVAIRERRTTGDRLLATLAAQPRTAGAAELRRVFALAAAGCHSPLEMWGHEHVFSDRRLPRSRCQVPVDLATGRVYLDRLYDDELVNVELDGAAYHGEPGQRERDIRRDAALAARGYVTLRFSHPRLHRDPASVIAEVGQVLATRRRQLR